MKPSYDDMATAVEMAVAAGWSVTIRNHGSVYLDRDGYPGLRIATHKREHAIDRRVGIRLWKRKWRRHLETFLRDPWKYATGD